MSHDKKLILKHSIIWDDQTELIYLFYMMTCMFLQILVRLPILVGTVTLESRKIHNTHWRNSSNSQESTETLIIKKHIVVIPLILF